MKMRAARRGRGVSLKVVCVLGIATAVLAGCGGEAQDGEDGESVVLSQLPAGDKNCPAGGVRVSVENEAHYVCNGQDGDGAGAGGGGSSSFAPVGLLNCNALPTMSNGNQVSLTYNIVTFSDGSAFVTCSVNSTGLVAGSSTRWFAPWQVGAASLGCTVASDAAAPATSGWWAFERSNGKYRTTYHDIGSTVDGSFYEFTTQNCPLLTPPG